MKTLILNGSPRVNGNISSLINKITEKIVGEYRIVDAYRCNISPCLDCRYCWKNNGCAVNDEMQEIYKYIQECDNILIASPLYFSELTGKLLDVGSRLQTYFCARFFRREEPITKSKKGAVYSHNTNERPAIDDKNALLGLNSILDFFTNNELNRCKISVYGSGELISGRKAMEHDVNLNIHYSAPQEIWRKIDEVYESMPYWDGTGQGAKWTGENINLWASVEPGGIQIAGVMPDDIWEEWYDELKEKLTAALGYEIGEPEDGFDFKYWE